MMKKLIMYWLMKMMIMIIMNNDNDINDNEY